LSSYLKKKGRLIVSVYIGLMSGTSMDGIDAALICLTSNQCLAGLTHPYSDSAKSMLDDVLQGRRLGVEICSQLNTVLGREFGQAVLALLAKARYLAKDVVAIGSHGQTICHNATADIPYTLQLGCAHTIAEMTGIPVVADFRTRDLVVGGQGAPFAPLYHHALFAQHERPFAVVNIGGLANVTFLNNAQAPWGYDTGPGNCLMDAWIQRIHNKPYDRGGEWASSGKVIQRLLDSCLLDPYFQQPSPKSLGKEYFSPAWLALKTKPCDAPEDIQATLLALTAKTIAQAICSNPVNLSQVVLCGGGVHNQTLVHAIQRHLGDIPVLSSAQLGVNPDYIEAMMFAWLAQKTLQQEPMDLSALTGARKPVILGAVYPVYRY
jgi:anhydro-N-acetylmuramic acid kinase